MGKEPSRGYHLVFGATGDVLFQGHNLVNRFHCNLRTTKALEILNFCVLEKPDLYLCCSSKIVHDPDMKGGKKLFFEVLDELKDPKMKTFFRLDEV